MDVEQQEAEQQEEQQGDEQGGGEGTDEDEGVGEMGAAHGLNRRQTL